MARPNAAVRSQMQQRGLQSKSGRSIQRIMGDFSAQMTGARLPAIKAAARILVKEMRKQVGKKQAGPSKPGDPPAKHQGRIQKSIGAQVVNGTMRVGSSDFRGRLMNDGVVFAGESKRKAGAEKFLPTAGARKGKLTSKRARKGKHSLVIAPRPWVLPSVEVARDAIGEGVALEIRRHGDR